MNIIRIFLMLIILSDLCHGQLLTMEQVNGPYGGRNIEKIRLNPYTGNLYAIADDIFYKTIDGISWQKLNLFASISDIAFHPEGHTFITTWWSGIYKSSFNDSAWNQVAEQDWMGEVINSIVINKKGHIYISRLDCGVYRSEDEGNSWKHICYEEGKLVLHPEGDVFLAATNDYFLRFTNNGDSFEVMSSIQNVDALEISPSGIIFVGAAPYIYKSTDNGRTWSESYSNTSQDDGHTFFDFAFNSKDEVFAASNRLGILTSKVFENNWILKNNGIDRLYCISVAVDQFDNIYTGTLQGVYASRDNANSWTLENKGIFSTIYDIVINSRNEFFVTNGNSGIFTSQNEGKDWSQTKYILNPIEIAIDDQDNIFAGTYNNGIYISEDDGQTWEQRNSGLRPIFSNTFNPIHKIVVNNKYSKVYTILDAGLFVSKNNGQEWYELDFESNWNASIVDAFDISPEGYIYVGARDTLYISFDNEMSWIKHSMIFTAYEEEIYDLYAGKDGLIICLTVIRSFDWTLYRFLLSEDYGETWRQLDNRYIKDTIILKSGEILVAKGNKVYRVITESGYLKEFASLPNDVVKLAITNDNKLLASVQNEGIFISIYDISVSIEQNSSSTPINNNLFQNYPNPFNPSTTINYYLQKSNNVILKIYNLTGQEIETLINGYQIAGAHKITWQPKGLPSGIYFYNLKAGDFSETKKLILQK